MKGLKKDLKLICVVLLIILASVGIGMGGGAPVTMFRKREDKQITIELFESHENQPEGASEVYKP